MHVECLNRWRNTTANPAALSACQTCGFKYRIEQSNLAIVICDPIFTAVASVLTLLSISCMLGALVVTTGKQLYGDSVSGHIYDLTRVDKTTFPTFIRPPKYGPQFDAFVVGNFLTGSYFCITYLQQRLMDILDAPGENMWEKTHQLVVFGIWVMSISKHPMCASRIAIIVGSALAIRGFLKELEVATKEIAQEIGERILEAPPARGSVQAS